MPLSIRAEFPDDALSGLNLQRERLFELLEQRFGLKRIVAILFQSGHKHSLRLDALLTLRHMPVGKLEMLTGKLSIDCGVHVCTFMTEGSWLAFNRLTSAVVPAKS